MVCSKLRCCTYTVDGCLYFRHVVCLLKYVFMCMLVSTSKKSMCVHAYHDICLYMYTKDGGEVSLEDARVVWLQPQRQLSNCAAALELTSSSRTANATLGLHSRSQAAEDGGEVGLKGTRVVWLQPQRQLSNCAVALELTTTWGVFRALTQLYP